MIYINRWSCVAFQNTHRVLSCSCCYNPRFSLIIPYYNCKRYCSSNEDEKNISSFSLDEGLPLLKNHPLIIWPSIVQMMRNWLLSAFIVRPYYDNTFSITSFAETSMQALVRVSHLMSEGNFEALEEIIDNNTLNDFKEAYKLLNTKDRVRLKVLPDEIIFRALVIMGLIYEDSKDENVAATQQRVFLEITMLYHVYQGLEKEDYSKMDARNIGKNLNPAKSILINLRFFREITKGSDDQYIINSLNYYKPLLASTK